MFGLFKADHGQGCRPRLREKATSSTWVWTNDRVVAQQGGTGTFCGLVKHELNVFTTWVVLTCDWKGGEDVSGVT